MQINWKVRFRNKVWLSSFIAAVLTFIYTLLGLFGVATTVTRNEAGEILNSLLMFLSLTGVIVDPTTAGLYDSKRAMTYEEPADDSKNMDIPPVAEYMTEEASTSEAPDPTTEPVQELAEEAAEADILPTETEALEEETEID